jgi:hypothetical protein
MATSGGGFNTILLIRVVTPLTVNSGAEDGDDAEDIVDELGLLGFVNVLVVTQELDATLCQHEFQYFESEAGESVLVCHRNFFDISLQASS